MKSNYENRLLFLYVGVMVGYKRQLLGDNNSTISHKFSILFICFLFIKDLVYSLVSEI